MVPPQELAVPAGNPALQRSSWKAEAIRRGQLKISGPLPFTDNPPSVEDAPPPTPPTAEATPTPPSESPARPQLSTRLVLEVDAQQQQQQQPQQRQRQDQRRKDPQPAVQEGAPSLRDESLPPVAREISKPQRHTLPVLSASYNSSSALASPSQTPTTMETNKRRKSGLRGVFRKMFGRRSKGQEKEVSSRNNDLYQSDSAFAQNTTGQNEQGSSNDDTIDERILSGPIKELNPRTPLGSHLPFPMNVNAPEESSPTHDYLTFDYPSRGARRRASLPSLVFSPSDTAVLTALWKESGGQTSIPFHETKPASPASPQIGVAVSVPPVGGIKRRSQSLGALNELVKRQSEDIPRQSAELKEWGATASIYRPTSSYSSKPPIPEEESERIAELNDILQPLQPFVRTDEQPSHLDTGIHAFNFGNLENDFHQANLREDDLPVAGPKTPLEDRLNRLENSVHFIEKKIDHLSNRGNRQTIILESAPKGRRSRHNSTTRDDQSGRSSPPSPILLPTMFPSSNPRPDTSRSTVNPSALSSYSSRSNMTSTTAAPTPGTNTVEQVAALVTIVRHERTARKALEKQVLGLKQEVQDLRALTQKFERFMTNQQHGYPTPSPDQHFVRSEEPDATATAMDADTFSRIVRHYGGVEPTDGTQTSRFSKSDSGDDMDDEPVRDTVRIHDEDSPEVFETPREEIPTYAYSHMTKLHQDIPETGVAV